MAEVKIYRASVEHFQQYKEIRLAALSDTPDAFGSTFERESKFKDSEWLARLERNDAATFIARLSNERCIGLASGGLYDKEAGLYSMWVTPQYRKMGIARKLVDAVIKWAQQNEYNNLLLDVGDANSTAIAFYQSMGFTPTGITSTLPPPRQHIPEHQRILSIATDEPLRSRIQQT